MIDVYNLSGQYLGEALTFGEARRMQCAALPEGLREAYAGISTTGLPLFYEEQLECPVPGGAQ